MKNLYARLWKPIPGILASVIIAVIACFFESLLPIHIVGSAVIAMFIGMLINYFLKGTAILAPGLKFTSKKILKFAIILLGLSLNITTVLNVGKNVFGSNGVYLTYLLWRRVFYRKSARS